VLLVWLLGSGAALAQQKFYPDDPLTKEPPPAPTVGPEARGLNLFLEFFSNTLGEPGERQPAHGVIPAEGINTLGEVPDGPWYVNRHGTRRMTVDALSRGPGDDAPPSREAPWQALTAKQFDVRPGILIADAKNDLYLLRFDPPGHAEMTTGAEMVSSKIFYALGYHVPSNYLVHFTRDELVASVYGDRITSAGAARPLTEEDLDFFLRNVARSSDGGYRAVATHVPRNWTALLGPYQVYGTRTDDPNDIVPHEHRRDLRGLFVFAAWLNHFQVSAVNTMDALVEENGVPYIRHHLVDFFATLGAGEGGPKRARDGNELPYDWDQALKHALAFGFYAPKWMRASYPRLPAVGRFEYETFDPERWTPNENLAPFANRLPDDEFWAAKQVMAFTDEDIRVLVSTGEYSDPAAADWIATCLRERRDRIGRTYFSKVVPLDRFRVENGSLTFDDLAVEYGLAPARQYGVRWSELDNATGILTLIDVEGTFDLPRQVTASPAGAYYAARIWIDDPDLNVTVYLRTTSGGAEVVGVEHAWPGKVVADARADVDTGQSTYQDLDADQQRLFGPYTERFNEQTGNRLSPQQYFDSLTISERTTYYAVTHALIHSRLTDESGASLGRAFDLVDSIERVAGQYYGRSGDQQFRLYVNLKPGAKDTLEQSQQFHFGHENTVYHAGYPQSFRQEGKEPTMQFSISEDGTRADIDVDYRSSKSPQALFNGHLTSSNSDVRAGDNVDRHNGRWAGLIAWWQQFFGRLPSGNEGPTDALSERPEIPTPTPPDRPRGAHIEAIADAVQEFLTDWTVRREVDDALAFTAPELLACVNVDDDPDEDALRAARARDELRTIMDYAVDELGRRASLTAAVDAVMPFDQTRVVEDQPFKGEFTLIRMTPDQSAPYLCGSQSVDPSGEYFGVLFRFKKKGAAVLGLLWQRQQGEWRIVAYRAFEQ